MHLLLPKFLVLVIIQVVMEILVLYQHLRHLLFDDMHKTQQLAEWFRYSSARPFQSMHLWIDSNLITNVTTFIANMHVWTNQIIIKDHIQLLMALRLKQMVIQLIKNAQTIIWFGFSCTNLEILPFSCNDNIIISNGDWQELK